MTMNKLKREVTAWAVIVATILIVLFVIDAMKHPEAYSDEMAKQLEFAIESGDESAIEYYNENYVANGRILFD